MLKSTTLQPLEWQGSKSALKLVKSATSVKSVKLLKSPTLTQKTFFAILCQFKRSSIPIFFSFIIVTIMGGFGEKMVEIDDDVFREKQRNVIWSKSFDHEIHPYIV